MCVCLHACVCVYVWSFPYFLFVYPACFASEHNPDARTPCHLYAMRSSGPRETSSADTTVYNKAPTSDVHYMTVGPLSRYLQEIEKEKPSTKILLNFVFLANKLPTKYECREVEKEKCTKRTLHSMTGEAATRWNHKQKISTIEHLDYYTCVVLTQYQYLIFLLWWLLWISRYCLTLSLEKGRIDTCVGHRDNICFKSQLM